MKIETRRRRCESGIYHIVIRGVNRQIIFECDDDFRRFISILQQSAKNIGAELFEYCLMSNHVHILLKEGDETTSEMMQRVEISYVKYFNKKYDRIGPLFQGRFCSKPVEDEIAFERVYKYIALNPVKAGISRSSNSYLWLWMYKDCSNQEMSDYDFSVAEESSYEMEHQPRRSEKLINDIEALNLMSILTGYGKAGQIQALPMAKRDRAVKALIDAHLSPTQISRITGVNRTSIYRIGKRNLG